MPEPGTTLTGVAAHAATPVKSILFGVARALRALPCVLASGANGQSRSLALAASLLGVARALRALLRVLASGASGAFRYFAGSATKASQA